MLQFLAPSYGILVIMFIHSEHLTDSRSSPCCPGPPTCNRSRHHLIEDGGIASCRGDPHLLKEPFTDGILVVRIEIGAAEDNPEPKRGRDRYLLKPSPGTPTLGNTRKGTCPKHTSPQVSLGLAKRQNAFLLPQSLSLTAA